VTDLDRPGGSSRYTWGDDDDTEVPAEGLPDTSGAAAGLLDPATEHELNVEVAALEADAQEAAAAAAWGERGPAPGDLTWDDDDVTDLHLDGFDEETGDQVDADEVDADPGDEGEDGTGATRGADPVSVAAEPGPASAAACADLPPVVDGADADRTDDRGATDDASPAAASPNGTFAMVLQADMAAKEAQKRRAAEVPQKAYSDVVYVFEPNTKVLPPLREYLEDLWSRRRFMVELARAESRGSRSSTVLGELWAVIDPLFQVGLYWFLLSIIRQGKGARSGSLSENLVLMVGGIFLFTLTSTTVTAGGRSILSAKNLMLNSTFPRALLPLSAAYKAVVEFLPTIFIYLLFHIAFGQSFGLGFFALPLLFVIQMVMGIGLGLIFATFTVFLRDTTNILGYIMRVLFFATPVIYPATAIPDSLKVFLQLNPLLALFTAYQAIILGGTPNPVDVVVSAVWATLFIVIGYRLFVSNERSFALRL
jgi:ABC-type polysaccharide/polyol phosphate export permease